MKINWLEKSELVAAAVQAMHPVEVVMDIGCGIVPQNFIRPSVHICCEPYAEYVEHLQNKVANIEIRDRSYVVLNMGWAEAVDYFPEKSVDTVFLVDVIEHLEKDEGRALLAKTEKIARQQVVVFTPLGFMPQHHDDGKDAWGLNGADWQEHKSGWLPEDFGDGWQIFASEVFHTVDSSSRELEKPFGALWAIKTNSNLGHNGLLDREATLKNFDAELIKKETYLMEKEVELNSLVFAKYERKVRRVWSRLFPR